MRHVRAVVTRARNMPVTVHAEQAVYGSFAELSDGYRLAAHSPACRTEWLDAFATACQRFGEPSGQRAPTALFAKPISKRAWMIVRVVDLGRDDLGRAGALGFHSLFLSDTDYRRMGAAPFPLAPHMSQMEVHPRLPPPSLRLRVSRFTTADSVEADADIAARMRDRQSVAIESDRPIDDLARAVWAKLPQRRRANASLATWVFANAADFDLAATPRARSSPQSLEAASLSNRIRI